MSTKYSSVFVGINVNIKISRFFFRKCAILFPNMPEAGDLQEPDPVRECETWMNAIQAPNRCRYDTNREVT